MKEIDALNLHHVRAAAVAVLVLAPALPLHAGPRTSANYSIATDIVDAGGSRATSANYTNNGSVGGIAGVSSVASPSETAKQGYIAQLYEVTALNISATPTTVNESATRQLSGALLLDDNTTIAVAANSISWSIQSGPISSISAGGLATAGNVYQDTAASVQGSYGGNNGLLGLTVVNVTFDDFGAYAGDGIGDDWQVQYFGQPPNANAGPLIDPDFDGHNNLFEFTTGIDPTNTLSIFNLRVESVIGVPTQKKVIFSPRLLDRTYTVKTAAALGIGASWTTLAPSTTSDNGNERTVTDTSATQGAKFYSVEITKP